DTHDPNRKSWLQSANKPECDFPIQNLPFGAFRTSGATGVRIGIAIGDSVLDLGHAQQHQLLRNDPAVRAAIEGGRLTELMALGRPAARSLRSQVSRILAEGSSDEDAARACLFPMRDVLMELPNPIPGFTDFATSINHVRRLGSLFNPDRPVRENFH